MSREGTRPSQLSELGPSSNTPSLCGSTFPWGVSLSSSEGPRWSSNSLPHVEFRTPTERNSRSNSVSEGGDINNSKHDSGENQERYQAKDLPHASDTLLDVLNRLNRIEGTLFGLRKTRFAPQGYADNYEQKYEPDELYEETGPNARIWRIYMDETATFDRDMIEEMRDVLDVLLVFAALFSAIITTFVAQTSQQLSQDYTQMTAFLIYESVQVQRALANGTTLSSVPQSPLTPSTQFVPDPSIVWINGLWFVSLTLSLIAALAAVLVKQWLHQYMVLPSGTVRERACIRHFRYMGFQTWQVAGIVGSLPVLVHISVGLFLAGIIVFLFSTQHTIALVIAAISGAVSMLYLVVNLTPAFLPSCPYRTPISDFAYWIHRHLVPMYFLVLDTFKNLCRKLFLHLPAKLYYHPQLPPSLKMQEKDVEHELEDGLLAQAIFWLHDMSSNPTVRTTALQALGGLPDKSRPVAKELANSSYSLLHTFIDGTTALADSPVDKSRLERLLRAWYFCMPGWNYLYRPNLKNMFEIQDNGYAFTVLLSDPGGEHLSMIEDLLRDNILGHYTHNLTYTTWNSLIDELKLPLKINNRSNAAYSFLQKIFQLRSWIPQHKQGSTLVEHLMQIWPHNKNSKVMFLLPEPVDFVEFCIEHDDPHWNGNASFIFWYQVLLCYYDRLNGHAQENYDGVDLHDECDCLTQLGELAKDITGSPAWFKPSRIHALNYSGDRLVIPQRHYQSFLEAVLSSSLFWDINPSCEPELLESIRTLKAEIKTAFSENLDMLKGVQPPLSALVHSTYPNQATNVDGVQGDLEMGLRNSFGLVESSEPSIHLDST